MDLSERKVKILNAIIRTYLETGEPVGSRTISKYTDLNLSSATIRNEMADLEELGFVVSPHTSAGRIPTDLGYRLYVDGLLKERSEELDIREKELNEKEDILIQKVDKVETMLKNMAKLLANNTNYTTMISSPKVSGNKIKFIQLSPVDEQRLLCVIVSEGNIIKNKIINLDDRLDQESVLNLNVLLNTRLAGLALEEINLSLLSKINAETSNHSKIVDQVMSAIIDTLSDDEDLKIYTSGTMNIFKYPELADSSKAGELINSLEEKEGLEALLNDDEEDIKVYIGHETPVASMKDCSVVTASYELADGFKGIIGIIGPKRMDYEKVMKTLKSVKKQLGDTYKLTDGRSDGNGESDTRGKYC